MLINHKTIFYITVYIHVLTDNGNSNKFSQSNVHGKTKTKTLWYFKGTILEQCMFTGTDLV